MRSVCLALILFAAVLLGFAVPAAAQTVYAKIDGQLIPLPEEKFVTNKDKASIFRSVIPATGKLQVKATIKGESSAPITPATEIYLSGVAVPNMFRILKLESGKNRTVVVNQLGSYGATSVRNNDVVEGNWIKEGDSFLFKPQTPLEPGEYAIMDISQTGFMLGGDKGTVATFSIAGSRSTDRER